MLELRGMKGSERTYPSPGEELLSPQEIEPGIILPRHLVIIPDGDRRWAMEKGLPASEGHRQGAKAAERLIRVSRDWGIQTLTLWGMSTDNVEKRSPQEISALMGIFENLFTDKKIVTEAMEEDVRIRHIGRRDRIAELRPSLLRAIEEIEEKTKESKRYNLVIALDYGGRDELIRAFKDIAKGIKDGLIEPGEINEELVSLHLDTAGLPDPDLIVRTSGEQRTSGILIFQGALSELHFYDSSVNFPDLTPELLREALLDFGKRERRFGGDAKKKK